MRYSNLQSPVAMLTQWISLLAGAPPSVVIVLALITMYIVWVSWEGRVEIARLRYTPPSPMKAVPAPKRKRKPKATRTPKKATRADHDPSLDG